MKLNWNCFNDVLKKLEELQDINYFSDENHEYFEIQAFGIEEIAHYLPQYSLVDIFYATRNLYLAGYIYGKFDIIDCQAWGCYASGITYKGHLKLQNDRLICCGQTGE